MLVLVILLMVFQLHTNSSLLIPPHLRFSWFLRMDWCHLVFFYLPLCCQGNRYLNEWGQSRRPMSGEWKRLFTTLRCHKHEWPELFAAYVIAEELYFCCSWLLFFVAVFNTGIFIYATTSRNVETPCCAIQWLHSAITAKTLWLTFT